MQFLRKKDAARRVGFHPEHVMKLVRAGRFPQPVRIGASAIAFVESEVEDWMAERVRERDEGVANAAPAANHDDLRTA